MIHPQMTLVIFVFICLQLKTNTFDFYIPNYYVYGIGVKTGEINFVELCPF
jgi:hypothetical protein